MPSHAIDDEVLEGYKELDCGAICDVLAKKLGLKTRFMEGIRPLVFHDKMVGTAVTVRFVPSREDLKRLYPHEKGLTAEYAAIEAAKAGDILVYDAMGRVGNALVGDIMATRLKIRGGLGFVIDGAGRDCAGLQGVGVNVYGRGFQATPGPAASLAAELNVPIQCGGVLVFPGDLVFADEDGVVVVPQEHISFVLEEARAIRKREEFVRYKLRRSGATLDQVYPLTSALEAEFDSWIKGRKGGSCEGMDR